MFMMITMKKTRHQRTQYNIGLHNIPDTLSHLGLIIDISIIFYTSEKTVPDTYLNKMT